MQIKQITITHVDRRAGATLQEAAQTKKPDIATETSGDAVGRPSRKYARTARPSSSPRFPTR